MNLRTPDASSGRQWQRGMRLAIDPFIVLPALTIFFFSLAALYSVVYHPIAFEMNPDLATDFSTPFIKHFVWGLLGIAGMVFFAFQDPDRIGKNAGWIYFGGLILLVAVLLFGVKVRNIRAWLSLGVLTFQPSELVKVILVIALARFLSSSSRQERPLSALLGATILIGIPSALVLKQPDMGTVIVYLSLLLTVPFAAGLPSRYLILIVVSGALAILRLMLGIAVERLNILPPGFFRTMISDPHPAFVIFVILAVSGTAIVIAMRLLRLKNSLVVWLYCVAPVGACWISFKLADHLKEYQKLRLLTFIAPALDPKGSGYNIIQSQVAFGSGRMLGKGFTGATQSALGFLPERQTDFIFSVIGEVFGFLGVAVVVVAFAILVLRIFWIGARARTQFGALLSAGTATIIITHVAVNMGMAIGVMPIMGIPLPLASYGGTAMVTVFTLLGLVLAVERQSKL